MSRIKELLTDICPDGVAFEPLGDISSIVPGLSGKSKADFTGGDARFVTYKDAYADPTVDPARAAFVRVGTGERQNRLRAGDVVFTGSSESAHDVGMSSVVFAEPAGPLYLNSFCFAVRFHDPERMLPGFSKHLFRSGSVREQIRRTASGVTRINVSKPRFKGVRIPVPSLEIQREIVRVLDKFTELEAELEAELQARRRQYAHYRNQLLHSRQSEVPLVALEDLIRLDFGSRITKSTDAGSLYSVYGGGGESFRTDAFNREDEWVVSRFAMSEQCVRRVAGPFWMLDSGFTFSTITAGVDKDYLGYMMLSMQPTIFATSTKSAQKNIDVAGFKRLRVPVPPLERQRVIVAILDNFDSLAHDLSTGLPAELAARRKQYEHYRDRLLTFKELAA